MTVIIQNDIIINIERW